jgi:kinesin family member 6/9
MIKEGKSINLSLHFLEQVIISLREQMKKQQATGSTRKKIKRSLSTPLTAAGFRSSNLANGGVASAAHHIPYRNSLLTTVLRDSLGGNCKSCFLLTISLDSEYFEESISTLRFEISFLTILPSPPTLPLCLSS